MIRIVFPLTTILITGILLLIRVCTFHKKHKQLWNTKLFSDNITLGIFLFFRILTLFFMLRALYLENYNNVFICLLTLILLSMPTLLEKKLKIRLPTIMEIIILTFIFAAAILGEVNHYYVNFPYWDTILHTTNGFLCAAIGFSLFDLLNKSERTSLRLSPLYLAITAFCFSMTISVLWEFFEFSMDFFWGLDMQKDFIINDFSSVYLDPTNSNRAIPVQKITRTIIETANGNSIVLDGYLDIGNIDTMKDLFVNFLGSVIFCTVGYFFQLNGKGKLAKQFIPQIEKKGDDGNT